MHCAVQTAVVTIISYKPLSDLNFARYTGQYGSYMPSSPSGVYKPLVIHADKHRYKQGASEVSPPARTVYNYSLYICCQC